MPLTETSAIEITCDNPACSHDPADHGLDPGDRTGWIFVSHEVYGEPTKQNVFCCKDCISEAAAAAPEAVKDKPTIVFATREEA